ncbi:Rne/Rng family ribonuclease [Cryobacterium sp. PH31-O1]|uniref:Rne/Rng family ribonuclease n=1 Tax=Cryobacterium sp. PH31-O1 TaxID=3046306 RepID=UPI0024BAE2DB|nr:Rne/Rng family ribonuclease [Cryobacterium sp. PH31-O1]MDJ0337074.1 Rne/Rng family ribonuclease [Cryobacterium sp. PH31-O1]
MVEDNENKKRKSLFGTRKSTRKTPVSVPTVQPAIEAPAVPVADAPAKVTIAEYNNVTGAQQMIDAPPTTPADAPADDQAAARVRSSFSLLFQAPEILPMPARTGIRSSQQEQHELDDDEDVEATTVRRRARRRTGDENRSGTDDPANTVVKVRAPREPELITEPQRIKGSTRLEAKKQRRRDGRDAGRRRPVITEAEFLARRESVDRLMVVRAKHNKIQIGVLEDGVLVEHYVAKNQDASLIGNVYLGRVQNVLPSMEAAFVDIGRGRNAVLYSGEVDWDAAAENSGTSNQARRIELALKPGDKVLVQVTKDPIGHKGARLTSQVSLPGRYLVYVPNGSMNGISRKLPDTERARLKKILKEVLPDNVGVIVRTAAEGATDEQLTVDVNRLREQWASIAEQVESAQAPAELHSEPDLLVKIVRDVFNEDFQRMVVAGPDVRATIETYLSQVAPDLLERVETYEGEVDAFDEFRISEQIEKALDRKVWLPSGGSLVIDRTEAMTVVDVNTGKFVGSGGNLEETVTKNNLEAAEEIVRQLRLRDIGGIIVVDFIDMVLESNRDLVSRRLIECLSRDRTKHQVAEVTSLGLVQMTRKKLGLGLLESFSENCEACAGRGIIVHHDPVVKHRQTAQPPQERRPRAKNGSTPGSNGSGSSGSGNIGSSSNGSGNRDNSGQRDGGNRDAHFGGNGASDAPKSGHGTHGITEDAKHALALIAARTITRTGSIAIVPAADTRAADADAVEVPPVTAAHPGTEQAGTEQAKTEQFNTEQSGTELAEPTGTEKANTEPTGTERSRGRQSRSRGQNGRGQQSRSEQARARQASEQASSEQAGTQQAGTQQAGTQQAETQQAETQQAEPVASAAPVSQPVSEPVRELVSEPVVDTVRTPAADAAPRTRGGRSTLAAGAPAGRSAAGSSAVQVPVPEQSESVDILDIPVKKSTRTTRRPSKQVTDQLLDSVLDSLPEPKLPGQGRARSRRVTTAGGAAGQPILTATGTTTSTSTTSQPPHGD